jgi:hypothetical protein
MLRWRVTAVLITLLPAGPALAQGDNPKRAPTAAEQAEALAAIREYGLNYAQRLPNYICDQTTKRTASPGASDAGPVEQTTRGHASASVAGGAPLPQRQVDVFEAQIGVSNGRETQKLVKINGQPAATVDAKALPGSFSNGEFNDLLISILDPQTQAQFQWDRWTTRSGRRMYVFSFRVPQSKGYVLKDAKGDTTVAYKGLLFADFETKAVMRIEMQCVDIPAKSGYEALSLKLNYERTDVAGQQFVLPSDFELNTRWRDGTSEEADAKYNNYRRFTADEAIQFGGAEGH